MRTLMIPTPSPQQFPPTPPITRITCGGTYGFFDEVPWIGGGPCPPPQWQTQWALNLSTTPTTPWGPETAEGNIPGYKDPKNASRWGWINYDWSDAYNVWQNELPAHMNEATLVKQCQMVKAEGTGTRCMVYRNTELALQWQETSRAAMTQANADQGWFLTFAKQNDCDTSAPCSIAAFNNIGNMTAPLIPCNSSAPLGVPNCAYCCNFTNVYNEPVGGSAHPTPGGAVKPRFGNNAFGDGQFFWDFRKKDVQNYWAEEVCLKGTADAAVDGMFTDDPNGYGAEHPAVQSMVKLTPDEIKELQLATQRAWMKGLALVTKASSYFPQAYRVTPPFGYNTTKAGIASCTAWMQHQCAVPGNESTVVYPSPTSNPAHASMAIASFLVSRGPHSYIGVSHASMASADFRNKFLRLDTGKPTGSCTEATPGIFTRAWSGGKAAVDCTTATGTLDFKALKPW